MAKISEINVIRSALWAAYGDALGFPTELVSAPEFKKKNSIAQVTEPIAWRRRVGGMFGPDVEFAAGTYSDDTQLRLSTSRAINGCGFFDVESFAKIELPVWLNYALGAGRGSKAAAANLSLRDSSWSLNFFATGNTKYVDGGGNGAAMRIQPHVWHNHGSAPRAFMADVIRNTVCTHGHPRAVLGAVAHAALLFETMQTGQQVQPADWAPLGESAGQLAIEVLETDPELPLVWIPTWERVAKCSLRQAWLKTVEEWVQAASVATEICRGESLDLEGAYRSVLTHLNGLDPSERGSGLKTALYASVLAWLFREHPPEVGLAAAANTFGSDTDTIATMAGALMGITAQADPSTPVQDEWYLRNEASRMFHVGDKRYDRGFDYPDLLSWSAPKSQSDAWVSDREGERLAGIGLMRPFGPVYKPRKGTELVWQWAELEFGQTVLVKRRASQVPVGVGVGVKAAKPETSAVRDKKAISEKHADAVISGQASLLDEERESAPVPSRDGAPASPPVDSLSLNELSQKCIREGFDPTAIGNALLSLMQGPDGIERAIGFAAIIAKAKVVRAAK